ncbi:MAG: hypothetical protein M1167_06275 [Chloroflexi bacterium]|nr:hypothetical protein [Chloroflexota bacterium]
MGIVAIVAVLLAVTLVGSLYLGGKSPTQTLPITPTTNPIPFDYRLELSPSHGTAMQGKSVQVNVTVTYVKGLPENVRLDVEGAPDGTSYSFSQSQGCATNNSIFTSTLTFHVSEATPTNTYNLTINSTADNGTTYSLPYTLSVINVRVLVSGTVKGGTGVVPTQIIFEQLTATNAVVQTFTAPVQSGQYSVSLPNKQFYAVSIFWESSDGTSGKHQFIMPWNTNADVGVTQIDCPFEWGP